MFTRVLNSLGCVSVGLRGGEERKGSILDHGFGVFNHFDGGQVVW